MKLSAIVPSIRPNNLFNLYTSLLKSYNGEFEFIVVSPYDLPENMNFKNVKLIKSFCNPTISMQYGISQAKNEYILWGCADDGCFVENAINTAVNKLDGNYKTVITGKYIEGKDTADMHRDDYYVLSNHAACKSNFIENGRYMFNVGLVSKQVLDEIGGLDCRYEVLPMAFNDISIRLQRYGCNFILQEEVMFRCTHMPGCTGDHAPIHNAQIKNDQPLFLKIFREEGKNRIKIKPYDIDLIRDVWTRRFNI